MKHTLTITILFFSLISKSQDTLQTRKVDYYFELLNHLILDNLKIENALDDSLKLKAYYFEYQHGEKKLNQRGLDIYYKAKEDAHKKLFKDWHYLEHVIKDKYVYGLYFSIAGFEDLEWQVVRIKKDKWMNQEKLDKEEMKNISYNTINNKSEIDNQSILPLFFNWDEGPKNMDHIKIFIQNDYLVLERGKLYHSLYDLKTQKTIVNCECPWCDSKAKDKESMNIWIKENLHNKIETALNLRR